MNDDDETYEVILFKIQETFSEHENLALCSETQWTINQNSWRLLPHVGCRVTPTKVREKGDFPYHFPTRGCMHICACTFQL